MASLLLVLAAMVAVVVYVVYISPHTDEHAAKSQDEVRAALDMTVPRTGAQVRLSSDRLFILWLPGL